MSVIYYYSNKNNTENFIQNGIKISQNFDKELTLGGYVKKCICALLNPKDDIDKFENEEEYSCLKLEVSNSCCFVVDSFLLEDGALGPKTIDLDKYIFGTYKTPEVLVTDSIPPENISMLNRDIDVPIFFNNSRDLFYERKNLDMLEQLSQKELYNLLRSYIYDREE